MSAHGTSECPQCARWLRVDGVCPHCQRMHFNTAVDSDDYRCKHCKGQFTARRKRLFCSAQCATAASGVEMVVVQTGPRPYRCKHCGRRSVGPRCQQCIDKQGRWRGNRRLAGPHDYTKAEIYDRDKGRCALCGKRVKRKASRAGDPKGPTIDHILPVSKGGHDSKANVQLAHMSCNAAKRDRVWGDGEQLRLIG